MASSAEPSLEQLLASYLPRWSLTRDGDPLTTPSSHVVFVASPFGPAVLKLFRPPYEEAKSSGALLHFGANAPRVYHFTEHALLMERIVPGTRLAALCRRGRDDQASEIICDIAARLRILPVPATATNYPTVEKWGNAFQRHRNRGGHRLVAPALVDEAEQRYFQLCTTQSKRVLLHGDLHHSNILEHETRGWLLIDPKGVIGEPEFELGAALRNPLECTGLRESPHQLMHRIGLMSRRLGYEPDRVLLWYFAQAALSLAWLVEDGFGDADILSGLRLAELGRQLLA